MTSTLLFREGHVIKSFHDRGERDVFMTTSANICWFWRVLPPLCPLMAEPGSTTIVKSIVINLLRQWNVVQNFSGGSHCSNFYVASIHISIFFLISYVFIFYIFNEWGEIEMDVIMSHLIVPILFALIKSTIIKRLLS